MTPLELALSIMTLDSSGRIEIEEDLWHLLLRNMSDEHRSMFFRNQIPGARLVKQAASYVILQQIAELRAIVTELQNALKK